MSTVGIDAVAGRSRLTGLSWHGGDGSAASATATPCWYPPTGTWRGCGLGLGVRSFAVSDVRAVCGSWWGRSRLFLRPGGHQGGRDAAARVRRFPAVSRVPAWLRGASGRVLRGFWENLMLTGMLLAGGASAYVPQAESDPPPPWRPLEGLPPGHPERLVRGVDLDAQEWALWADILGREPRG